MKIALFTETYFPSVNGVAAHVQTLCEGLCKLGHEVLVVTADKHCKHHYIEDGILHCPSLEMKRLYGFGAASPFSYKRMRMIEDFAPDVIHIHQEFGIGLSGILIAKQLKIPLVYTLHTMYDQYIYYVSPKAFIGTATKFSHKYSYMIAKSANVITGPSKKCDEYFRSIGIEKAMSLIPNSADLEAFNPAKISDEERNAFLDKYSIPRDKMLVCFAGRLGQEKSVDVLLEYWAQTIAPADGLHLVVIGGGPEEEALRKLSEKLGIESMVTFTGFVKHDEVPIPFSACDIYATASLTEMNSISMLEAMASGLTVLQRYDEPNADQIKSGVNGYFFNNAEELAEKLRYIRSLAPEALVRCKKIVMETVSERGSADLAKYMLGIYRNAQEDKKNSAKKSGSKSRVKIKVLRKSDKSDKL